MRTSKIKKKGETTLSKLLAAAKRLNKKRLAGQAFAVALGGILIFLFLHILFPFRFRIDYSQEIVDQDGKLIYAYLTPSDKWRLFTPLQSVSEELKLAILQKEDHYFYWHWGVNPLSIFRAAWGNIISGERQSGASTITMQVVRLLEKRPRTYPNKCIEMFRALQLELRYSKEEILEMYLNLLPYGGNIEGVRSASLLFLGKEPAALSWAESVMLSIVPNRPNSLALGHYHDALKKNRNRWLKKLFQEGMGDATLLEDALLEPIQAERRRLPRIAPHLATRLHRDYPHERLVITGIDGGMQYDAAFKVKQYCRRIYPYGILNAAAIIIDNQTMEVKAYVGSKDFYDAESAGQVDGARAMRSPGSTLKPLVYGIGFDQGLITPKTVLFDLPTDFQGYSPENFDRAFHGKVTAETALSKSLNLPAVGLLHKVSVPAMIQTLEHAGFSSIHRQKNRLGLSLALGGCGVTLEELVGLYGAFANGGIYQPVSFIKHQKDTVKEQILSPEATSMVTAILKTLDRPDFPHNVRSVDAPDISWKTGTSYGRRDAWSIGYNHQYTIGVWVGNHDGTGVRELTGANIATPLLYELFAVALRKKKATQPTEEPTNALQTRLVCAATGLLPSDLCEQLEEDVFIPTISSIERCTHRKKVWVSEDESESYCGSCMPSQGIKRKVYDNPHPALLDYLKKKDVMLSLAPDHAEHCEKVFQGQKPRITSPLPNHEYIKQYEEVEFKFDAQCTDDVREIFWFVDGKRYAQIAPSKPYFTPLPRGRHKITCTDDKGRSSSVHITVR